MPPPPQKILVVRNDRLGDFMLAYPTFLFLEQALPRASIHALVPEYTREMADCCGGIDATVLDPGPRAGFGEQVALLRRLRRERYDALVVLFSTARIGWLTLLAGIPYRLAPATKLTQVLFNRRLVQRRSRSAQPEYEYDLDLGRELLKDFGIPPPPPPPRPYLSFTAEETRALDTELRRAHRIPAEDRLVFLHPGSGGSAGNLATDQYAVLARALRSARPFTLVITAGPGDEANAERLAGQLEGVRHALHHSRDGLRRFAQHIAISDLFISGSTGPLHIAGALDRPTAAFYTRRRSATSLRWQTLNSPDRRLAFSPPEGAPEEDLRAIDVAGAAAEISRRFLGGE